MVQPLDQIHQKQSQNFSTPVHHEGMRSSWKLLVGMTCATDAPSSVCVPNGPPLEFCHRDAIDGLRSSKKFPAGTMRRSLPFKMSPMECGHLRNFLFALREGHCRSRGDITLLKSRPTASALLRILSPRVARWKFGLSGETEPRRETRKNWRVNAGMIFW